MLSKSYFGVSERLLVWVALTLSLCGLLAGSLLVALGYGRLGLSEAVEGLVAGAVPVLVASRLLPHLNDEIGIAAWVLAVGGYGAMVLLERRRASLANVDAAVVLPALAVHSAIDGAALAVAFEGGGSAGAVVLGGALVLHRLPEGLLIGSVFVPRVGVRRTLGRLAWLATSTVAGAVCGKAFLERVDGAWLHGIVAIGFGVMVRLVVHRHGASCDGVERRPASTWPFCAGAALALAVAWPGDPSARLKFAAAGLAAAVFSAFDRFHASFHATDRPA